MGPAALSGNLCSMPPAPLLDKSPGAQPPQQYKSGEQGHTVAEEAQKILQLLHHDGGSIGVQRSKYAPEYVRARQYLFKPVEARCGADISYRVPGVCALLYGRSALHPSWLLISVPVLRLSTHRACRQQPNMQRVAKQQAHSSALVEQGLALARAALAAERRAAQSASAHLPEPKRMPSKQRSVQGWRWYGASAAFLTPGEFALVGITLWGQCSCTQEVAVPGQSPQVWQALPDPGAAFAVACLCCTRMHTCCCAERSVERGGTRGSLGPTHYTPRWLSIRPRSAHASMGRPPARAIADELAGAPEPLDGVPAGPEPRAGGAASVPATRPLSAPVSSSKPGAARAGAAALAPGAVPLTRLHTRQPPFQRGQPTNSPAFKATRRSVVTGYTVLSQRGGSTPGHLGPGSHDAASAWDRVHARPSGVPPVRTQLHRPSPAARASTSAALGPGSYGASSRKVVRGGAAQGADFSRASVRPGSAPVAGHRSAGFVPDSVFAQERRAFLARLQQATSSADVHRSQAEAHLRSHTKHQHANGAPKPGHRIGHHLAQDLPLDTRDWLDICEDEDAGEEGGDTFDVDAINSAADASSALARSGRYSHLHTQQRPSSAHQAQTGSARPRSGKPPLSAGSQKLEQARCGAPAGDAQAREQQSAPHVAPARPASSPAHAAAREQQAPGSAAVQRRLRARPVSASVLSSHLGGVACRQCPQDAETARLAHVGSVHHGEGKWPHSAFSNPTMMLAEAQLSHRQLRQSSAVSSEHACHDAWPCHRSAPGRLSHVGTTAWPQASQASAWRRRAGRAFVGAPGPGEYFAGAQASALGTGKGTAMSRSTREQELRCAALQ
jgi:hypothetical protein